MPSHDNDLGIAPQRWWRSPLRGPWLTSMFAVVLLIGLPIVTVTGLLDYVAYNSPIPGDVGWLRLPPFTWPTSPPWLFKLVMGLHVVLGLVLIPVVLAKLWSVLPKLFQRPPARSPAQAIERLSMLLLVGGILFEIATGVLNIQYDYVFGFSFYHAHYYGAWVFIGAFVAHVAIKLPRMLRSLRSRSLRAELRTSREKTEQEPPDEGGLVAPRPARPTMARRGALGLVGGGALLLAGLSFGQVTGGWTRQLALLLPRGRSYGDGPNDFQINKTAEAVGLTRADLGGGWRLELTGGAEPVTLDLAALRAMRQHTAELPIACVEGWATTEVWTGVRLRQLAARAGVPEPVSAFVRSVQSSGPFRAAGLQANQVMHPDSLLALRVNGAVLGLDHGYPARIMVPALPGVHCTKWVGSIEFRSA